MDIDILMELQIIMLTYAMWKLYKHVENKE